MRRVPIFRPEAEAQRWYEGRRLGLGEESGAAVDATVARMVERPLAFPRVRGETRRAVFIRFPYALYFRVPDESIVVLAVHGRQNPVRWRRRA